MDVWRKAEPEACAGRPRDYAAMAQVRAGSPCATCGMSLLWWCCSWLPPADGEAEAAAAAAEEEEEGEEEDEPGAEAPPAPEFHAAALAAAAAAARLLGRAAAPGARATPAEFLRDAAAPLLQVAAAAPGAAGAFRAAPGGPGALGDAVHAMCAAAADALPVGRAAVGAFVDEAAAALECEGRRSSALARLLAASGAARELARFAAARWRAAAACSARAAAARPARGARRGRGRTLGAAASVLHGCACAWCAGGFGAERATTGQHALDFVLERCLAAARREPGAAAAAAGRVRALAEARAAGKEAQAAAAYAALAGDLAACEGALREAFERDEAPALRRAAARAAAQVFCCSNVLCERTAGMRKGDEGALAPALRCARCGASAWCSEACRAADWSAGHEGVCRALTAEEGAAGGA
jgi:hypothetical protein